MFVSTPDEISDEVLAFCKTVVRKVTPIYVDVTPAAGSKLGECFSNVENAIARNGGSRILGWTVWSRRSVFIEAENHCVWQNEADEIYDVTPTYHEEARILFLIDKNAAPVRGLGRNNRRKALVKGPLVKEYVRVSNAWSHASILMRRAGQWDDSKEALRDRQLELIRMIIGKYGGIDSNSDRCPTPLTSRPNPPNGAPSASQLGFAAASWNST